MGGQPPVLHIDFGDFVPEIAYGSKICWERKAANCCNIFENFQVPNRWFDKENPRGPRCIAKEKSKLTHKTNWLKLSSLEALVQIPVFPEPRKHIGYQKFVPASDHQHCYRSILGWQSFWTKTLVARKTDRRAIPGFGEISKILEPQNVSFLRGVGKKTPQIVLATLFIVTM